MKNAIIKLRMIYHLKKTNKALVNGDKKKYEKHATMVHKILWDAANGSKRK